MKLFLSIFAFLITVVLLPVTGFSNTPPNLDCDTNANNNGSKVGIFYFLQGQNSPADKAAICSCVWQNAWMGCQQNKLCPYAKNPAAFYTNILSKANFKTGTNNININCLGASDPNGCKRSLVFFTSDSSVTGYTDAQIQANAPGKTLSFQSCPFQG